MIRALDLDPDQALFGGEVQGLAVLLYQNERPLAGVAGTLDWVFAGCLSSYLRAGAVTGETGQCTYLPVTRHGITYHLLFVGAGASPSPGAREKIPAESLRVLQKNLLGLKLEKIGISRSDFGNATDDFFERHMKGCPLCIVN